MDEEDEGSEKVREAQISEGIDFSIYVYYDANSPTGLGWNRDVYTGKDNRRKLYSKDEIAGSAKAPSRVSINGKQYYSHRVVVELSGNKIPPRMVVDHLNGNNSVNLESNLKVKTQRQNCQNSSNRTDNKTGHRGINLECKLGKYWYYSSRIGDGRKENVKLFSISKLGPEIALAEAIRWRNNRLDELNSIGENYTSRHGCSN